jgi:hypothetical protein
MSDECLVMNFYYTLHYKLCTKHYKLCTKHYKLCTKHYKLCTKHYKLCTKHYALKIISHLHQTLCRACSSNTRRQK